MEPPSGAGRSPVASGWRRLPTAWIHFIVVELIHVYAAVYAWQSLMSGITGKVYMANKHVVDTSGTIKTHFWEKYFWGHAPESHVQCDDFVIKEGVVHGFGFVWQILAWLLPLGACTLVIFCLSSLAKEFIWSFEHGAYLKFSWALAKSPIYRNLVILMASGPTLLLAVWCIGAILYPKDSNSLNNNIHIMQDSLLPLVVLLFSLNMLAFPSTPVHHWSKEDMVSLKFRRGLFHLFFGTNANFGMKLTDALWTGTAEREVNGKLPETSRLVRYFWSREEAELALQTCQRAQLAEVQRSHQCGADASSSDKNYGTC